MTVQALQERIAAKSQMELDYDLAIAEAKAEGDAALADALYREAARFDQAQREQWRQQEGVAQGIYELARDRAEVGDSQGYAQLGFSQAQIGVMETLWQYWKTVK